MLIIINLVFKSNTKKFKIPMIKFYQMEIFYQKAKNLPFLRFKVVKYLTKN